MWPFSPAPRVLVRVKFCELAAVPPVKSGKTYTYVWRGRPRPKIGSRAWVRALNDNVVAVIVTDFGAA
ncbi:ASCH domain-containing protein [Gulosibacter macacae]|uniref:ASCH domain-containing protein n=1 Tax=Gulosibacter macacae TaxID=2488791 RepID=A0A3P3VVW7_9MICO|nr:ASCH domain-containing protein [Gulosibacter macacae]RRJ85589.1 ASCH domain-containing protein [Gulosibacter macacae]